MHSSASPSSGGAPLGAATLDATVVIPTLNGDRYLAEVLDRLAKQEFGGEFEVLVIDSGSTDDTLAIVRARPWVRLHEIPNREFGHGRTRNLAARMSRGRNVAYLTQDAIPGDERWLTRITQPLDSAELDVVAVVGKQTPRERCFPLMKYEIRGAFANLGPDGELTIASKGEGEPEGAELDALSFYSDVNSATRREFLINVIPYQDLPYSEDFAFARDLILAGYRKAYAPDASVVHSNDLSLREYGKRIFEETIARRRVGHHLPPLSRAEQVLRAGYGVLRDSISIVRDPDYGVGDSLAWLVRNPAYQVAKWRNIYRATRVELDDHELIGRHSLETERVRAARREGASE